MQVAIKQLFTKKLSTGGSALPQEVALLLNDIERLKYDLRNISVILNSIPFPIWQRDSQLRVTYRNLAYIALLEQSVSDEAVAEHDMIDASSLPAARQAQLSGIASDRHEVSIAGNRFQVMEMPVSHSNIQIGFALSCDEQHGHEKTAPFSCEESYDLPTCIYDQDMAMQYYNDTFVTLWQCDRAFLDQRPSYLEMVSFLREARMMPEYADYKKFKESRVRLFSELAEPLHDCLHLPDGRTVMLTISRHASGGLVFSYEDKTQQLAFERSYNMLFSMQKAVLEQLGEGIAIFAQNGCLNYCNSAYVAYSKLDKHYLAGNPHMSEMIEAMKASCHGEDWLNFKQTAVEILSERTVTRDDIRIDGRKTAYLLAPLPDGGMMISLNIPAGRTVANVQLKSVS